MNSPETSERFLITVFFWDSHGTTCDYKIRNC